MLCDAMRCTPQELSLMDADFVEAMVLYLKQKANAQKADAEFNKLQNKS